MSAVRNLLAFCAAALRVSSVEVTLGWTRALSSTVMREGRLLMSSETWLTSASRSTAVPAFSGTTWNWFEAESNAMVASVGWVAFSLYALTTSSKTLRSLSSSKVAPDWAEMSCARTISSGQAQALICPSVPFS